MVDFKFAKFHCYQQIQSFLITPYNDMNDSDHFCNRKQVSTLP
jgi:hypothetical protein